MVKRLTSSARRQRREAWQFVAMLTIFGLAFCGIVWACVSIDAQRGMTVDQSLASAGF